MFLLVSSGLALSCTDADAQIWNSGGSASFKADEKSCALKCGGAKPCTGSCMSREHGYSPDCGQCFGGLSACVVAHCVVLPGNCGINPNGASCKTCTDKYCTPTFESCTGFKTPSLETVPSTTLSKTWSSTLTKSLALSCTDADAKIWNSGGSASFKADEKSCALKCGGAKPCTGSCMSREHGYSHDCGQCFGGLSACVVAHCVVAPGNCGINPNGASCKTCTDKYCTPTFESCTGFKTPSSLEAAGKSGKATAGACCEDGCGAGSRLVGWTTKESFCAKHCGDCFNVVHPATAPQQ